MPIFSHAKCGNVYTLDHGGFEESERVPIVELGEPDAVQNLKELATAWTVIYLWCSRAIAQHRFELRGDNAKERLQAWDNTVPVMADLVIDTSSGTLESSIELLTVLGRNLQVLQ